MQLLKTFHVERNLPETTGPRKLPSKAPPLSSCPLLLLMKNWEKSAVTGDSVGPGAGQLLIKPWCGSNQGRRL